MCYVHVYHYVGECIRTKFDECSDYRNGRYYWTVYRDRYRDYMCRDCEVEFYDRQIGGESSDGPVDGRWVSDLEVAGLAAVGHQKSFWSAIGEWMRLCFSV